MARNQDFDFDDVITASAEEAVSAEDSSMDLSDVHAGVTVGWLANIFRMDRNTVKRRLAGCQPNGRRRKAPTYQLRQAAAYLVDPTTDISSWIKNLRPNDLPPLLQATYWDAALKRQKWERDAGDLWRTTEVLDTLGDAFQRMKNAILLWSEVIERENGLSAEQRKTLAQLTDDLQNDMHEALVQMPKERQTRNMSAELDEEKLLQPQAADDDVVSDA